MTQSRTAARPVGARVAALAFFLANGSGIGAWAASIALIKRGLGLSDSALATALFAFAAGSILAMPVTGWLIGRVGARRVMLVSATVDCLTLLALGYVGSLPALACATLVMGISKGLLDVSMNHYALGVQRAWGRSIMSSFHAAFSIGGLVGSAGMGVLFALGGGRELGLTAATIVVAAILLIAAFFLRRPGQLPTGENETAPTAFALPNLAVLGVGLLCFLCMLIEGGLADWSGVYLTSEAGASAAGAAAGYAAFSIMMAFGRLVGDGLVRRRGGAQVARLGAGLAAAGLAVALLWPTPIAIVAGFALVGLGVANVVPLLFTAAGRTAGMAPGVGIAMAATIGYAGFLLGPPVIGTVADAVGLRLALLILLLAASIIATTAGSVAAAADAHV